MDLDDFITLHSNCGMPSGFTVASEIVSGSTNLTISYDDTTKKVTINWFNAPIGTIRAKVTATKDGVSVSSKEFDVIVVDCDTASSIWTPKTI
jgi:hypothetical protein